MIMSEIHGLAYPMIAGEMWRFAGEPHPVLHDAFPGVADDASCDEHFDDVVGGCCQSQSQIRASENHRMHSRI